MHATFQSFPRDVDVYFQWHEPITGSGGNRKRQTRSRAVDTCRHFDWVLWISNGPTRNLLLLETQGARAAFAVEWRIYGGQDREGDCCSWHFAICPSDATVHNSVALFNADGISARRSTTKLLSRIVEQEMHSKFAIQFLSQPEPGPWVANHYFMNWWGAVCSSWGGARQDRAQMWYPTF